MRFVYLDNGAVYLRWGKGEHDWFMVWDPAYQHARWTP